MPRLNREPIKESEITIIGTYAWLSPSFNALIIGHTAESNSEKLLYLLFALGGFAAAGYWQSRNPED